jgi:hypothetical protein
MFKVATNFYWFGRRREFSKEESYDFTRKNDLSCLVLYYKPGGSRERWNLRVFNSNLATQGDYISSAAREIFFSGNRFPQQTAEESELMLVFLYDGLLSEEISIIESLDWILERSSPICTVNYNYSYGHLKAAPESTVGDIFDCSSNSSGSSLFSGSSSPSTTGDDISFKLAVNIDESCIEGQQEQLLDSKYVYGVVFVMDEDQSDDAEYMKFQLSPQFTKAQLLRHLMERCQLGELSSSLMLDVYLSTNKGALGYEDATPEDVGTADWDCFFDESVECREGSVSSTSMDYYLSELDPDKQANLSFCREMAGDATDAGYSVRRR